MSLQRKYTISSNYDDLIDLPHHVSKRHARMSRKDRAAQFAPFAALTGHHEAIRESERLTVQRIELDEACKEKINWKLQKIKENIEKNPLVTVTYFVPDKRKEGGTYVTVSEMVQKLKEYEGLLVLESCVVPIADIGELEIGGLKHVIYYRL